MAIINKRVSIPVMMIKYSLLLMRTSLAGYVALTGEFVNLDDAHNIPEDVDYTFNNAFDDKI
jgi:hypothetical protein